MIQNTTPFISKLFQLSDEIEQEAVNLPHDVQKESDSFCMRHNLKPNAVIFGMRQGRVFDTIGSKYPWTRTNSEPKDEEIMGMKIYRVLKDDCLKVGYFEE